MTRAELRQLLERRLSKLLAAGVTIEIHEGDRLLFREVVDRSFRLELSGEQDSIALWFRPIGEPEWEPRIGADTYPIERARCLLIDRAVEDAEALSIVGPIGRARIAPVRQQQDVERFATWLTFRELWLSPEDEAALDKLRS
jgi:hypothetical protein